MPLETQQQLLERALTTYQQSLNAAGSRKESKEVNYSELAHVLGISRQAISQIRCGAPMSAELAARLAGILKDEPEYVMVCAEYNKVLRLIQRDEQLKTPNRARLKLRYDTLHRWEHIGKAIRRKRPGE